jgi:uncharacterized membrane protein YdjX (TVP38/TMEM64 family)
MHVKEMIWPSTLIRQISRFIQWYTHLLNNPSQIRRTLSLSILVFIAFVSVLGLFKIIDPYPLKDWIYFRLTLQDLGVLGGIIFILMVAVLSLISPISLFIMTGSASFGPILGMILSYIGALLNANLTFFLVKALLIEHEWGLDKKTSRIKGIIQNNGYPLVLVLQLITVIPFVAINSAAAVSGVKWRDFIKATSMGVLPCVVIYSFLGDFVVSSLLSPRVYFAFMTVIVVFIIVVALKRKRNIRLSGKHFH